jgi:hypothetical protein
MYDKERLDARVTILTKCILEIENKKFDCLVENISTEGALIKVDKTSQGFISVGDTGIIKVLLLSPVNFVCSIVRKYPEHVGLKFAVT